MTPSSLLSRFRAQRPIFRYAEIAALVLLVLAAGFALRGSRRRSHPLVATPQIALESVASRSLYFNGPAYPWLLARRADLLPPEAQKADSERVRSFSQAVQNPTLFRQLDRQLRFDTLLLAGDPSQYHPLLEHLLDRQDWTLTYLDHTTLVFKREQARPWEPADLEKVRARLDKATPADLAEFLSQAAVKMVAVRRLPDARRAIDEARKLDAKSPWVWGADAQYHLARGAWADAVASADRALAIEKEFVPALACKAQALYSTKHFADAYHCSEKLMELAPNDPGLLFYHAKIAHEARAFNVEIRALQKLITLAEQSARSTAGYRLYLAQAYARDGQAEPALQEYARVLADPDLPKEQRADVESTVAQIKQRVGQGAN